ncbi:MAG: hypothetical protein ACJAUP_000319 [Cellvibrionaceae bacterium]|jgi:hypothetical protein
MKDETYAQQVNRRLTAARLLLMLDENSGLNSTPVGRNAVLESALLQLYFALNSYLNELLLFYRIPHIENPNFNLDTFLSDTENSFEGINDFSMLKNWGRNNGDIFSKLSSLPIKLAELSSKNVEEPSSAQVKSKSISSNPNFIVVSDGAASSVGNNHNGEFNLDNKSDVKKLVDEFQLFVGSQREGQAEY